MTTRVTVNAHAGWPIEVVTVHGEEGQTKVAAVNVVPANEEQHFYIHSGMKILSIRELPRE